MFTLGAFEPHINGSRSPSPRGIKIVVEKGFRSVGGGRLGFLALAANSGERTGEQKRRQVRTFETQNSIADDSFVRLRIIFARSVHTFKNRFCIEIAKLTLKFVY